MADAPRDRVTGHFTRWRYKLFEDDELDDADQAKVYEEYLDGLALYGEYAKAAEAGGWNPKEIARLRQSEPWFQALCDDAIGRHTSKLVDEAHRRASEGTPRFALGGRERDRAIQVETVYSDRLMELALKRRDPSFGDKTQVEISADLNIASLFNYRSLSTRARRKLRELLEIIKEDAAEAQAEKQAEANEEQT